MFAGFSTTTTDGDMGGRAGANALCGADFPGSHMCHTAEYYRTHTTTTPPATGAWVDYSAGLRGGSTGTHATSVCGTVELGLYTGAQNYGNCGGWTSTNSGHLGYAIRDIGATTSGMTCNQVKPVACCF